MKLSFSGLSRFAWATLAYNILVILFGAYVRATGSGAGCGAHWPLCNGVVLPRPERVETIIEFTHRITSGLALVLVLILVGRVWRAYGKGSLVRKSAFLALFFTITEALVGAGLVLFQLVEDNDSIARAISMVVHLVNTFLLTASLVLTAWWVTDGEPERIRFRGFSGFLTLAGVLGMLLLGASGAIAALGDTLFPSTSLVDALREDFSPTAHYLIQLRVYHPAIAVSLGIFLFLATAWLRRGSKSVRLERFSNILFVLYVAQLALGIVNVALLAPVWMQIVHLLVTNLIWIIFVLLASEVFGRLTLSHVHQSVNQPIQAVSRE